MHCGVWAEDSSEPAPSHLSPLRNNEQFLNLSTNNLTVRYHGKGTRANDVGAIQANLPCPRGRMVYYFEMTVLSCGDCGRMSIGLTDKKFDLSRQPGCDSSSYSYSGEEGKKFHASVRGVPYGPAFTTGDTVGCGICFTRQEIFFTLNGKFLGSAFRAVEGGVLYPTVATHSFGESLTVNFGVTPFKFDLDACISAWRAERDEAIAGVAVPPCGIYALVCSYLSHYGYRDTLAQFQAECPQAADVFPVSDHAARLLQSRSQLRGLIMSGNIEASIAQTQEMFPGVLEGDPSLLLALHCQQFIELFRNGLVAEAIQFSQDVLGRHLTPTCTSADLALVQNAVGLLAYVNPSTSPLSSLLELSHRESVADRLNAAILRECASSSSASASASRRHPDHTPAQVVSPLESVLQHLKVLGDELRKAHHDCGDRLLIFPSHTPPHPSPRDFS